MAAFSLGMLLEAAQSSRPRWDQNFIGVGIVALLSFQNVVPLSQNGGSLGLLKIIFYLFAMKRALLLHIYRLWPF